MRRIIIVVLSAALLSTTGWAIHAAAARSDRPLAAAAAPAAQQHPAAHVHAAAAATGDAAVLADQLAAGRLATAKYATNLHAAQAAGYQILTRMIPDMGWHFINPGITGFDIRKPPILVYERHGRAWQLAAFEWVFPTQPATPPLPGATYGSFGAACHYKDGSFVFRPTQDACPKRSPETGAAFNLWHPDLVTLHVWLWYPNPAGLYNGTNPYIRPFNGVACG
jgi:hypothetical protein